MKIVAFLPVKGSSSRIKNKNLKLLDGSPLFLHTLEKLLECEFIDEVYLDTESDEIIDIARQLNNVRVLKRDPDLASNDTDGNKLFMNEVRQVHADIYVQILCTSPFISKESIRSGIDKIKTSTEYDSAVMVRKEKIYLWDKSGPKYNFNKIPNSVDLEDTIIESMGLYIVKKDSAVKNNRRIGDKPFLLEASPIESIDVNNPDDFYLASLIQAGKRENERKLFRNIQNLISSPILSDVLDDMGFGNQIIMGLTSKLETKSLGRAKTLKLAKIRENDNFKDIYKALDSYSTIIPGDIIIVENEVPDYAYFGELNANLAIRSGAIATIIDGMTRDGQEVMSMGYPVFARGHTCKDVRKRAILESFNKKIKIQNIEINKNDLVFADNEGVVIIPRQIEDAVINKIIGIASDEKKMVIDIACGLGLDGLKNKYGNF